MKHTIEQVQSAIDRAKKNGFSNSRIISEMKRYILRGDCHHDDMRTLKNILNGKKENTEVIQMDLFDAVEPVQGKLL